jgi:hypothetical protein
MNKIYWVALVALLSVGVVASASYARISSGKSGFMTFGSYDLIGVPVRNSQGRFLGLVDGIMIGSDGQAFAIVNHGDYDLYGPGGANIPVPIAALRISETKLGKEKIVLNTDTEHMDFAPYLDPTRSHDRQYEANIDTYFGVRPAWGLEGSSPK